MEKNCDLTQIFFRHNGKVPDKTTENRKISEWHSIHNY